MAKSYHTKLIYVQGSIFCPLSSSWLPHGNHPIATTYFSPSDSHLLDITICLSFVWGCRVCQELVWTYRLAFSESAFSELNCFTILLDLCLFISARSGRLRLSWSRSRKVRNTIFLRSHWFFCELSTLTARIFPLFLFLFLCIFPLKEQILSSRIESAGFLIIRHISYKIFELSCWWDGWKGFYGCLRCIYVKKISDNLLWKGTLHSCESVKPKLECQIFSIQ